MRKQFSFLPLVLLAFALGYLGCASSSPPKDEGGKTSRQERILLLAPNLAEMVWHLDAGDQVVGVSAFTDFPEEASTLPQVMTGAGLDLEKALALKPTFAIGIKGFTSQNDVYALQNAGCRTELLTLNRVNDLLPAFSRLAKILETDGSGRLQEMSAKLQDLKNVSSPRHTLMVMPGTPAMAMGDAGFPGSLLGWVGAQNVIGPEQDGFPFLEEEALSSLEPDVVLLVGEGEFSPAVLQAWKGRGVNPHIGRLNADYLVRPGPRTGLALEEVVAELQVAEGQSP